jgi:hypothetical protein
MYNSNYCEPTKHSSPSSDGSGTPHDIHLSSPYLRPTLRVVHTKSHDPHQISRYSSKTVIHTSSFLSRGPLLPRHKNISFPISTNSLHLTPLGNMSRILQYVSRDHPKIFSQIYHLDVESYCNNQLISGTGIFTTFHFCSQSQIDQSNL